MTQPRLLQARSSSRKDGKCSKTHRRSENVRNQLRNFLEAMESLDAPKHS
jgi:hypothetical protein